MSFASAISAQPPFSAAVALLQSAQLPTQDLTEKHLGQFFYAGPASAPVGLVGLEMFGDVALLRSLVVTREMRGTGLGTALLDRAEAHARSSGARSLYLLTTTAEKFFAERGYVNVSRESAPASIRATREFAGICPASSAFMTRIL